MKHIFLVLFIFSSLLGYSQNDTIWFNNEWKVTQKEKAAFFRSPRVKVGQKFQVKDHFVSGKVQSEGLSLSSTEVIWDGLVTYYYPKGPKQATADYVNNLIDGEFNEYYETGELKGTIHFKNNKMHGDYKLFDKNGKVLAQRAYMDGVPNGKIEQFYPNGNLDFRGYFKMGAKDGHWEGSYEDGRPKTKYFIENDKVDGKIYAYNESGELGYEGEFNKGKLVYFKNGGASKLNGSYFILKGAMSKHGVEEWKLYRDDILITETYLIRGIKVGTWKMYSLDGKQLVRTISYGDLDLCAEKPVAFIPLFSMPFHSFPDYYFKLFAHNVSVVESEYAQGCLHGPTKEFDENGHLLLQIDFENGKEIHSTKFNNKDGIKRAKNSITFVKE